MSTNFSLSAWSLWSREMKRFYRQPSRVIGALGSPLVFWLLIGFGVGSSFSAGKQGVGYLEFFFPGTLLLILFFTAIFSTFSLIEDRKEGFLQSVLVAPVSRSSIVFGKVAGGTALAVSQGVLFLLAAPFIGFHLGAADWVIVILILILNGFMLTALGFILAWRMESVQGFHALMNLVLMPLWLVSGALFPPEGAPAFLQLVMKLNPMTYGLAALRQALYGGDSALEHLPSMAVSVWVSLAASAVLFLLAVMTASRRSAKDLT